MSQQSDSYAETILNNNILAEHYIQLIAIGTLALSSVVLSVVATGYTVGELMKKVKSNKISTTQSEFDG